LGGFALSRIHLTLEQDSSGIASICIYGKEDNPDPKPDEGKWGKFFKIFGIILLVLLIIAVIYYFFVVRRNNGIFGGEQLIQWCK